ncbi:MAG: DUF4058 family protein [Gemmataceae bacterium]|nr:DUF4058 family protein [Gemmataceae bacterium]
MPLLDHFHPPLSQRRHWESFHAAWATALADSLNDGRLPEGYFAEELITVGGRVEIDVATWEETAAPRNGPVATQVWTAPAPVMTMPAVFLDTFAVKVYRSEGGPTLVAAVEFVSPGNKDRESQRRAFAVKCANYLHQGIGLAVVDIVTSRLFNLHNEIVSLMAQSEAYRMPHNAHLYAVAYRPVRRDEQPQIDLWPHALALGNPLPTLPLALSADVAVPLELETTYADVCRRRID